MSDRREWNQGRSPLLPWEQTPGTLNTHPNPETFSTPDRPVLYDAKGKPLMKARPRLGFRPEDAR